VSQVEPTHQRCTGGLCSTSDCLPPAPPLHPSEANVLLYSLPSLAQQAQADTAPAGRGCRGLQSTNFTCQLSCENTTPRKFERAHLGMGIGSIMVLQPRSMQDIGMHTAMKYLKVKKGIELG